MKKVLAAMLLLVAGSVVTVMSSVSIPPSAHITPTHAQNQNQPPAAVRPKPTAIGRFTPQQFSELLKRMTLPNTTLPTALPPITGNAAADVRIRLLAEKRGYRRWPVADGLLAPVESQQLQPEAAQAWRKLKAAAAKAGIKFRIVSGYRSPEAQRVLFMGRLGYGYGPQALASGQADAAINTALTYAAPPGYSKHHTGYTIDVDDDQTLANQFATSRGYAWLSNNNFFAAKKFGFIPSFPKGATNQGPRPEAWEYVWVGAEQLLAQ